MTITTKTSDREELVVWQNGNATVTLLKDGTRKVEFDGELNLEFPLNVDIRISNRCAFGMNSNTGKAICDFCHESATTDGKDFNVYTLIEELRYNKLPAGIELAIGANQVTPDLFWLLKCAHAEGWICNLTINQGHTWRDLEILRDVIHLGWIKGLGISYRKGLALPHYKLLDYPNTVFHVIAGIDTVEEVLELAERGVRKVLVLGEKDFGFNKGRVSLKSENHVNWYRQVRRLFDVFEVVSFDNLALQQLNVKRFVMDYDTFYQGEHSFYINAVDQTFSPSSRSSEKVSWADISVKDYFKTLEKTNVR